MAKTDEELMIAYQKGDIGAFEALYQRSASKLYGYLIKKQNDRTRVDDLFQKVFLKFHQNRDRYDPKYNFEQWLFVIARSVFLDELKKFDPLANSQALDINEPIAAASESQRKKDVDLKILPKDQRQVVELRIFDELSYREISEKLSRTEISVRKTFSRAIKKLRGNYGS